jgi:hypothetical protein
MNGNLAHFAAFKAHIGFYPASSGITAFQKELTGFKTSRAGRAGRGLEEHPNLPRFATRLKDQLLTT